MVQLTLVLPIVEELRSLFSDENINDIGQVAQEIAYFSQRPTDAIDDNIAAFVVGVIQNHFKERIVSRVADVVFCNESN